MKREDMLLVIMGVFFGIVISIQLFFIFSSNDAHANNICGNSRLNPCYVEIVE